MVMEEQHHIQNPNPNPNRNKKKKKINKKNSEEFEFCKVCNRNHNQGRRHIYFPNHTKSLSSFLSRFLRKLSDLRFFLNNPAVLRPELASQNQFWCVFCDSDIDEVRSSFACGNAINHLASPEHLGNLKGFLRTHGGGIDRLDSFRILEADLDKWEKKCKSLKSRNASSSEGSSGPHFGPSNDIHNEINYKNVDCFDKNTIESIKSSHSNGVMPLQFYTNEKYQISHLELSEAAKNPPLIPSVTSLPRCSCSVDMYSQHSLLCDSKSRVPYAFSNNVGMQQVYQVERMANGGSYFHGLQNLTQIPLLASSDAKGNVHSAAVPPWFEETEVNAHLKPGPQESIGASKSSKSRKLNPKRVGAAWAEKRKIELEKEKSGAIVANDYDTDWLPNFGRVWQSGSRKETRKEFEKEKQTIPEIVDQPDTSIKIQPYISKRMRKEAGE